MADFGLLVQVSDEVIHYSIVRVIMASVPLFEDAILTQWWKYPEAKHVTEDESSVGG